MMFLHSNPDLLNLRFGRVKVNGLEFCAIWSRKDLFFLSTGSTNVLEKAKPYCSWIPDYQITPGSLSEKEKLRNSVASFFKGKCPILRPNPKGTKFQILVWKVLLGIPRGETLSYGEVAALVGKPKACRAVGTACGKNPVAFIIPCHRVIQASGGLGGFGLTLPLKKKLLQLENVF